MFGTLGGPEVILILVVALIVFGPRRLPEIGKSMGKMLAEFRKASNDFKRTIEDELEAEKTRETHAAQLPPPDTAATVTSPDATLAFAASTPVVATVVEPVSHDTAAAPVVVPVETAPHLEPPAEHVVSRDPHTGEK
jgi:TatA/E family protein of Tat protein translocase